MLQFVLNNCVCVHRNCQYTASMDRPTVQRQAGSWKVRLQRVLSSVTGLRCWLVHTGINMQEHHHYQQFVYVFSLIFCCTISNRVCVWSCDPFSFSWLSWQVHRSLAVLLKGSAVTCFLQEFHRLHSSSKPVTGFVTFITVPHTLCRPATSHAALHIDTGISKQTSNQTGLQWDWNKDAENTQTKAAGTVLHKPQSPALVSSRGDNQPQHRADTGTQIQRKPLQLYPKPLIQPEMEREVQSKSVEKPKYTMESGHTRHNEKEKSEYQIQSHLNLPDHTHYISTTAEKNAAIQESDPLHTVSPTHRQHRTVLCETPLKNSNLDPADVSTEGLFFQQRNRNTNPLRTAADLNTQRGQRSSSHSFKPKPELQHDNPKLHPPPTTQHKQANTTHQFLFTPLRGHTPGVQTKFSFLETRRQAQPQRYYQPQLQPQTIKEPPASTGAHLRPQLQKDPKLFLPGTAAQINLQSHAFQQPNPLRRLNWSPQNHSMERHSSFRTPHRMGQMAGWGPLQSSMNTPLRRSKSMNERQTAGFSLNRTFS